MTVRAKVRCNAKSGNEVHLTRTPGSLRQHLGATFAWELITQRRYACLKSTRNTMLISRQHEINPMCRGDGLPSSPSSQPVGRRTAGWHGKRRGAG